MLFKSVVSALTLTLTLIAPASQAQKYPDKPIQIIVPFAAGGGADIVARLLGQRMSETWGQPVIVENRPGASGNIGTGIVAKARPDGYTLLMASSAYVINPNLYKNIPYDPIKSFVPITQPALLPNILVVNPSLPVKSVTELIAYTKSAPKGVAYASAGTGTGTHLAAEMFKLQAGVEMLHVPYKGGGAVLNDLLGGQVSLTFATLPSVLQYVKTGKLRPLAMTTTKRWSELPDVPTLAESGLPGFEISTWIGLLAPAGTPQSIVDKIHAEVVRIVQLPEVREHFTSLGMEPVGDTPAQFSQQIKSEVGKYAKLVEASGAKLD